MTPTTKRCTVCEVSYSIDYFHLDKHQADGHTTACRGCRGNQHRRGWLLAKHRDRACYFRRKAEKWKARAQSAEAALKAAPSVPPCVPPVAL